MRIRRDVGLKNLLISSGLRFPDASPGILYLDTETLIYCTEKRLLKVLDYFSNKGGRGSSCNVGVELFVRFERVMPEWSVLRRRNEFRGRLSRQEEHLMDAWVEHYKKEHPHESDLY